MGTPQMRQIVRALAQLFPTAIVSGRGREKVKAFVKLKELYYAGSHGMDIAGPQARTRPPLSFLSASFAITSMSTQCAYPLSLAT